MKVLLAISSYSNKQQQYLYRILEEYNNMNYNIDCYIYTTTDANNNISNYKNLNIIQIINPLSIGENNAWAHRKLFIENKNNYDLFIYTENDHLITQNNIETFLKVTNELPKDKITGFIQYELKPNDNNKYTIVLIKGQKNRRERAFIVDTDIVINNKHYFEIQNRHQGCYILTKEQLAYVINTNQYKDKYYGNEPYGNMESICTQPYLCYHKIFPYNELQDLFIHHLPNKYINNVQKYTTYGTLSLEELKKYENKYLKDAFL